MHGIDAPGANGPGELPDRIIDRLGSPGPVMICVGALHGNEPGGVEALQRVCARLRKEGLEMGGTLLALRGNRPALQVDKRAIERDLNRVWTQEKLDALGVQDPAEDDQTDREQRGIWQELDSLRKSGRPLFLLDLHSTSGGGPPFVVVLGKESCQRLATQIGAPCVHGLNESIRGTLASWFSDGWGASMVVEGGKSKTESTVRHLEAAVYSGLGAAGLLPESHERVRMARQLLRQESDGLPEHVKVFHREATHGMGFEMGEGHSRRFRSFDAVLQGDVLAENSAGQVLAPSNGYLIMPLYQDQGGEGFFLAHACPDPFTVQAE